MKSRVMSLIRIALLAPSLIFASVQLDSIPSEQINAEEMTCGYFFERYPKIYFSASTHRLSGVSVLGDTLEMDDGSVWKINPSDKEKAFEWRSNDPITITQTNRWFSNYKYQIINQTNNSTIEVNLFLGIYKSGPFYRYITSINYQEGIIFLSDYTHWEISYLDRSLLNKWIVGDAIIIGVNTGWDSKCEGLLINTNENNCIRVRQF
jgi:hypothetical protein